MYRKILFPTDFSRRAGHALLHVLKLADIRDGEVIVQHVVTDYFERLPHWTRIFDVQELHKHMDRYVAVEMRRIIDRAAASPLTIRPMISKGQPAEEIEAAAEEEMVDLIVMAPSTGAITSRVIEKASRPVMAVPREGPESAGCRKLERILVATDFSHRAPALVDHVFRLHAALDASVYMLHVIEATCAMEAALRDACFSASLNRLREWAINQLASVTPTEFLGSPRVHRMVEVGPPSDVIMRVAREMAADLIIVGNRDRGHVERQLIGTNADRILKQAGTSILALPA